MESRREIIYRLLDLDLNVDSKGFEYWIQAIQLVKKSEVQWNIIDLYEKIALDNGDTYKRVERAMRYCLEGAKERVQQVYNYNRKIDNSAFLRLITMNYEGCEE